MKQRRETPTPVTESVEKRAEKLSLRREAVRSYRVRSGIQAGMHCPPGESYVGPCTKGCISA